MFSLLAGWWVVGTDVWLGAAEEPRLSLSSYRIEPSADQLLILPDFPARWWIPAELARSFDQELAAAGYRPELVKALQSRLRADQETGDGVIVPDEQLLALFSADEHARWCEMLSRYPANVSYRWPLSFRPAELDELASSNHWCEAVHRIRRWAVRVDEQVIFGDVFLLQDAFGSRDERRAFLRAVLAAPVWFLKLQPANDPVRDVAAQSAYWQVNGRYRAIEPFLNAVTAIDERPRIDVVHLLPRLPRALLNTFPPDLESAPDPGIESSVVASQFFETESGLDPQAEGTFADWLQRECEPVEGASQYGDIIVYGDLAKTPWPYAGVYVAGNMIFARRPTLLGPWQFISRDEVGKLNPRLARETPRAFRRRGAGPAAGAAPFVAGTLPAAWWQRLTLQPVTPGPWGRLWFYNVMLAPPGDTLEKLEPPASEPVWVFDGIKADEIQRQVDDVPMPDKVRSELHDLFAQARWEPPGLLVAHPTMDLVLATPRELRARIFPRLQGGGSVSDYAQHIPFPSGMDFTDWFDLAAVPPEQRDRLAQLFYPYEGGWRLSDFGALYHALSTVPQQLAAQRAALRVPALVVLLERPTPAEAESIAEYWTGGKDKSTRLLLQTFAASDDRFLDITHLLPPIARELVNTYFMPAKPTMTPSCFWTAFNFGAEEPDERYLVLPGFWTEHREQAWEELQSNYERVAAPSQLGDIIAYRPAGANAVEHVCAFVADGVVFTKNGYVFSAPWCLATLASVDELYLKDSGTERLYFRKRQAPP